MLLYMHVSNHQVVCWYAGKGTDMSILLPKTAVENALGQDWKSGSVGWLPWSNARMMTLPALWCDELISPSWGVWGQTCARAFLQGNGTKRSILRIVQHVVTPILHYGRVSDPIDGQPSSVMRMNAATGKTGVKRSSACAYSLFVM